MGKTDYAYEYVKEKIISGEYPPLSDISEDILQKELNVSRTPVREALLRLEKEDMVYIYPRKGTIVTAVTLDLIEDIYGVRELVEPSMAVSSMQMVSKEWLLDIKKRFAEVPEGLTEPELRRYYIDLDTEFHSKSIANCPNRYLTRLMNNIHDQNLRLRIISSHPTEGEGSIEEHAALIDALLEGDAKKLEKLLKEHLAISKLRTIQHFRYKRTTEYT
ncbi:MAG: GntR family transcriptional regulator [Lachnospiraceae bacterium]|nr:GntR family transcriptional regulator [Lachnospiraceae bacterium]